MNKKSLIGEFFTTEDRAARRAEAKNKFMWNGNPRFVVVKFKKGFIVVSKLQLEAAGMDKSY